MNCEVARCPGPDFESCAWSRRRWGSIQFAVRAV